MNAHEDQRLDTEHEPDGTGSPTPASGRLSREEALTRIAEALRDLQFGTVTAVVHEGQVVVVERTEKVRLGRR